MNKKEVVAAIVRSSTFTQIITFLIILNCILIGVELDCDFAFVSIVQKLILIGFTIEIGMRWIGKSSVHEYVTNGWNWFDIFLVSLSYTPDAWIPNPELLTSLRILRVFRVFRLIKAFPELQIITKVLFRSIASLFSVCLLMLIVMYVYSIMGVILFRGQSEVITGAGTIGDPFGGVLEAMFSMFRVLTGEDWTDLRYDLIVGGSIQNNIWVTLFFISFYVIAAFLLINLVVGAVCNNYDDVMRQQEENVEKALLSESRELNTKLDAILARLDRMEGETN